MTRAGVDRRHGFTLIEVLIAVVIIALGMIGLSALFAGSARQQQLASEVTKATTAARNIEAQVAGKFDKLRDKSDLAACIGVYANDPTQVRFEDRLNVEWRRLDLSQYGNALTLNQEPRNSNGNACAAMYFQLPMADFSMLDLSALAADPQHDTLLAPYKGKGGFAPDQAATQLPSINRFFMQRSIVPESPMSIEVTVASLDPLDMDYLAGPKTFVYEFDATNESGTASATNGAPSPVNLGGPCNQRFVMFRPKQPPANYLSQGWAPTDWWWSDFIRIDTRKCPIDPELTGGGGPVLTEPAGIVDMNIFPVREAAAPSFAGAPEKTERYIQKIVVRNAAYRTLEVLSLRDRVQSETTPDGVTDTVAGTVLVRGPSDTNVQVAVFTYSLTPDRFGPRFIPNEDRQNTFGKQYDPSLESVRPVRRATVELVYNNDTETYWVFADKSGSVSASESWLARSGEDLLFAGDASATPPVPGADSAVQIVRVITLDNATGFWCELSRAPRSGVRVVGETATQFTPRVARIDTTTGRAGRSLAVYGVNDLVHPRDDSLEDTSLQQVGGASRKSDTWKLRSINCRVSSYSR